MGCNARILRMPFKFLKNAGFVPAEVELFRERGALSASLERCKSETQRVELRRTLSELEQKISLGLEALRINWTLLRVKRRHQAHSPPFRGPFVQPGI
jgi:hypothetical protein